MVGLTRLASHTAARTELRRRLALPSRGSSDEVRSRLERRIERLKAQHEWGDIEDTEYRAKMQETRAELALLPEPEKVVTFDAVAGVVASLREAIGVAAPEQLKELIGMLIERVKVTADGHYEIEPVPAARPFFAPRGTLLGAPPDGLPGAIGKVPDVLAWYAETSDLTDIARSERLAARFESALHLMSRTRSRFAQ